VNLVSPIGQFSRVQILSTIFADDVFGVNDLENS
jgi:hypothetical protein